MTALEDIPTMTATEHVLEVFRRTHAMDDAGQWERSDAVAEAVAVDTSVARARDANDGSHRVIEHLWSDLVDAGIAEPIEIKTLARYRNVADAWPPESRVPQASYDAHRELVSRTYDRNRGKILKRLVQRSSRHVVTRADVRTYKSEMKPKKSIPFDIRIERHVRKLFKGELRPAANAAGEWNVVVRILDDALAEARRALAAAKDA